MHRINSLCVLLIMFFFGFTSCKKQVFFNEYQSVKGIWYKDDIKTFLVEQEDTLSAYNLFLNLGINKEYPFSNLFIILKTEMPDSKVRIDTLEYQMAKPDGTLLGVGFSDFKQNKLWLKEGFIFPIKGKYQLSIEQAIRKMGEVEGVDKLNGISEIGIQIEKIE